MKFIVAQSIIPEIYADIESFIGVSIYHTREWHHFIEHTFGWRVQALLGYEGNRLVCFLPFVQKRRLGRLKNIALPLSHSVGLAIHPDHFQDFTTQCISLPMQTLEAHEDIPVPESTKLHLNDNTILDLTQFSNEEEIFRSFDKKSIRYEIKRGVREGIRIDNQASDQCLDHFYQLVAETRHRQGSPLYPPAFFKNMRNAFANHPECLSFYVGYHGDIPVSGAVFFFYDKRMIYGYSASTNVRGLKLMGANELIMWNAIQQAYRRGVEIVEYGTSPVSLPGLRAYKEKWGGVSAPLNYTFYPSAGKKAQIERDSFAVRFASKIFSNMPMELFKKISPIVFKTVI